MTGRQSSLTDPEESLREGGVVKGPASCYCQLAHLPRYHLIVQELCESRGGRPGLSVLTSILVSVDVKQY